MLKILGLVILAGITTPAVPAPVKAPAPTVPVQTESQMPKCDSRPCIFAIVIPSRISPDILPDFNRFFQTVAKEKPDGITMIIDSYGGVFDVARQMIRILKASHLPIYCHVEGHAASAAFWMLQTCDVRSSAKDADLMMHQAILYLMQDRYYTAKELRSQLSQIQALDDIMADDIAPKMQLSKADYLAKIKDNDWHMSASQALANHAIDRTETLEEFVKSVYALYGAHFEKKR